MKIVITRTRIKLEMNGNRIKVVRVEPAITFQTSITAHG